MNTSHNVFLIDGDSRRRAAISHCVAGNSVHIEPFEDPSELIARWPRNGLLLVNDNGKAIGELLGHMGRSGHWLPVIGFTTEPSTRQVVNAMLCGAIDFIAWPFAPEELIRLV